MLLVPVFSVQPFVQPPNPVYHSTLRRSVVAIQSCYQWFWGCCPTICPTVVQLVFTSYEDTHCPPEAPPAQEKAVGEGVPYLLLLKRYGNVCRQDPRNPRIIYATLWKQKILREIFFGRP